MAIGRQAGPRKRRNVSAPDRDHNAAVPALEDVGEFALLSMIGSSPIFNETVRRMGRIAMRDASVLIEGETGSGKEVAARAIHYLGARRGRPFIPVNCGAVPDSLIEAEFFGHGRGAFTDAREARAGLIAQAHGGTLFLDEIDSLTPKAQVALLRFLQDQKYKPIGRDVELEADVRIIAATNKSLIALANSDRFRTDLLHRLRILYLYIPPLREREGDAEMLAQHFLRHYLKKYNLPPKRFAPESLRWIGQHRWEGNVRELDNAVHREVVLADGDVIRFDVANSETKPTHPTVNSSADDYATLDFQSAKAKAVHDFERGYLTRILQIAHGNVSAAARIAEKERRAFGKLLKKHQISREQFK
ncbi:MAG: sigma-54 dependent transcriptional regulator [Acidobacteria bacterium]|nr:sigma-54 dependent transcriptional regulator [Acidobacteriota bacterium]